MEIRTLRYFLAVAREENMTKAAETLHVTQPTLSKALKSLEEELGKKYSLGTASASGLRKKEFFCGTGQMTSSAWLTG